MARANLNIDPALVSAFASAQDGPLVRSIFVRVDGETLVPCPDEGAAGGSAGEAFDALGAQLPASEARFVVFCTSAEGDAQRQWVLVAWVPDAAKVRDKMLFSASRDDFKAALGRSLFAADYYANDAADMSWELFQASGASAQEKPLTETERLAKEADAADMEASRTNKSSGMGVVPFNFGADASAALRSFGAGAVDFVLLELLAEEEAIRLVDSGSRAAPYSGALPAEEPRFALLRVPRAPSGSGRAATAFFLLSVPESCPIKVKMLMATAKNSVIAECAANGVATDKTLELRDTADLDSSIEWEVNPPKSTGASSAAAVITSRAAAPRGRRPRTRGRGRGIKK